MGLHMLSRGCLHNVCGNLHPIDPTAGSRRSGYSGSAATQCPAMACTAPTGSVVGLSSHKKSRP